MCWRTTLMHSLILLVVKPTQEIFKVLKRDGGGIIVSMLEQATQELMDRFGVKAVFTIQSRK